MKWLLLLVVILGGIGLYLYKHPEVFEHTPTMQSHHGTARLFMEGALAGNPEKMKAYCKGMAESACEGIVAQIRQTNSTFERYSIQTGGTSGGSRTSARASCYGKGGDMFMVISFTMEQGSDGNWRVVEVVATATGR